MYSVRLNNFEGPLDLLLFFIRRDELDIYDIPIASITQEFLEYVKVLEILDLELAGEFIVMASMLVQRLAQCRLSSSLVVAMFFRRNPDLNLETVLL